MRSGDPLPKVDLVAGGGVRGAKQSCSAAPVLPAFIANLCPQLNWLVALEAHAAALILEAILTTSHI